MVSNLTQAAVTQQFVVAQDLEASFIAKRCNSLQVRACASRTTSHSNLNRQLHLCTQDVSVGCFRRVAQPASLGDSLGNRFRITLRRCQPSAVAVHARMLRFSNGQFINYFGVQRVGETACVLQRCRATAAWACVDLSDLLPAPPPFCFCSMPFAIFVTPHAPFSFCREAVTASRGGKSTGWETVKEGSQMQLAGWCAVQYEWCPCH